MSAQADKAAHGRPRKADAIAEKISESILAGKFEAGARLPTEKALCEQFGVSRTVIREAISRIKADGVVNSLQGSGLYVAHPFQRRSFKFDQNFESELSRVIGLFELREPVEMAAARLAAARHTHGDLARISAAHAAMINAADWSEEGVTADLDSIMPSRLRPTTCTTRISWLSWRRSCATQFAPREPKAVVPRSSGSPSSSTLGYCAPSSAEMPRAPHSPCTRTSSTLERARNSLTNRNDRSRPDGQRAL